GWGQPRILVDITVGDARPPGRAGEPADRGPDRGRTGIEAGPGQPRNLVGVHDRLQARPESGIIRGFHRSPRRLDAWKTRTVPSRPEHMEPREPVHRLDRRGPDGARAPGGHRCRAL